MLNRMSLATLIAAASLTALSIPAAAKTNVDVFVNLAPPAVRYEHAPAPRIGFVWTPGYWDWRGNTYVWIGGSYVRERPGYDWYAPQWVRGPHGWYHQPGRWDRVHYRHDGYRQHDYRDNDRDGIPNYRDPFPNGRHYNHGRHRGHGWYDSDRDGIPNYRDRRPYDHDNDGRPDRWDRRPYDARR